MKIIRVLGLAAIAAAVSPAWALKSSAPPSFHKVVIVILENTNYEEAVRQPFLSFLAKKGALLSNYHAVAHPSLPNYIALTSGGTWGVESDHDAALAVPHIGDLLDKAGKSWKVYAEGYPGSGACFLGPRQGLYVRKHVPFLSYKNVQNDFGRCANVVSADEFAEDFSGGALPDFSLYIPDLNDDGHDTGVAYADRWFKKAFGPLINQWPRDVLLAVTFDEDGFGRAGAPDQTHNQVYTVLYGGGARPGAVSRVYYTHYSLLKTVEAGLGLGSLGAGDRSARLIDDVWL